MDPLRIPAPLATPEGAPPGRWVRPHPTLRRACNVCVQEYRWGWGAVPTLPDLPDGDAGSEMARRPSMLGPRAIPAASMTDESFRGNAAARPVSRIDRGAGVRLQVLKDVVEHAARSALRPGDDLGFA
jgi:hypothetical protein